MFHFIFVFLYLSKLFYLRGYINSINIFLASMEDGGYFTTFTILKNGSIIARIIVPTTTQSTMMMMGSSIAERFFMTPSISLS